MTIDGVIAGWETHPDRGESIVNVHHENGRDAIWDDLDPPPPPAVVQNLLELGIERLYRHQAAAIRSARTGAHTVVAAGTASGKSLCYQLPIAESVEEADATAILIYPTKALSRDQLRGLAGIGTERMTAAAYDGDTPADERRWIRDNANVVLTNPDMLHVGMLPNHPGWSPLLRRLRYIVIDELHSLRGSFGSHAALVLRRLRRLAAAAGSDPTFLFTSATIGNPGALASALIGDRVEVIDQDAAPAGPRTFVLWNPELEDVDTGTRAPSLPDSTAVFTDLVTADIPSILFAGSRKATELSAMRARERIDDDHAGRIAAYRAGYLPEERRRVEDQLASGDLLGVTTTNALELGIDIGGLEGVVMNGFPGTISSFRQQSGRAGRKSERAIAVLVAGQDQLDQYYMHHPEELFGRAAEAVVINPHNPAISAPHVECAAHEAPLTPEDRRWFGEGFEELVTRLVAEDRLGIREGRIFWKGGRSPASSIDLRGTGGGIYSIVDRDEGLIGSVDESRAFSQTHAGAVYLHQGDAYLVAGLDVGRREVSVRREDPGYYTQTKVDKDLIVSDVTDSSSIGPIGRYHGTVEVESHVVEYRKKAIRTGAILDTIPLDLPPRRFHTEAVWYTFPLAIFDEAGVDQLDVPGTLHAMEHCAIGILPVLAVCDRWDIGGLSTVLHPDTGTPVFFVYDGYPGGTGIAPLAYDMAERHLTATLEALRDCPCETGCPSCVQSPKCGNFNEPLATAGARRVLSLVLA